MNKENSVRRGIRSEITSNPNVATVAMGFECEIDRAIGRAVAVKVAALKGGSSHAGRGEPTDPSGEFRDFCDVEPRVASECGASERRHNGTLVVRVTLDFDLEGRCLHASSAV